MCDTALLNHASVWDVLHHAMDSIPSEDARWRLRGDADCHRNALLDALEFIGVAIEASTMTRQPREYTPQEIAKLGSFLMSAPELIRGMEALTESYDEIKATGQRGADHE
ncbi:hypothetical protein NFT50_004834 [Salmonella enterica]|nr:hypothetical protein [Salmonella enterica]EJH7016131.1 hypothetical protein [Salmonella enterica]EJH7437812.1 hypothetical protein [Salmonella enterica]EJH7877107.1 hypothetical protein [Salmonella enterica]EJH7880981.1 hypothetical protein [Salmonella enterica]